MKKLEKGDLIALVEPDVFAVKARQEDKVIRINITLPRSLLEPVDTKSRQLHISRSALFQKAVREII